MSNRIKDNPNYRKSGVAVDLEVLNRIVQLERLIINDINGYKPAKRIVKGHIIHTMALRPE
ncbi:MAG: hypothetical protein ACRDBO_05895 [Lachnospiraceae bacterium]